MKYYQLEDDMGFNDRWFLSTINIHDNWLFSRAISIDGDSYKKLEVVPSLLGRSMDYTTTNLYKVSIVSAAMAECLHDFMDDIQLIPVIVSGIPGNYYVLIVKNAIDCVDEERSEYSKFEEGNGVRPEEVGEYEAIDELKIDVSKVNRHIFRLAKYDVLIIVSEKVKKMLTKKKLTGLDFELVS